MKSLILVFGGLVSGVVMTISLLYYFDWKVKQRLTEASTETVISAIGVRPAVHRIVQSIQEDNGNWQVKYGTLQLLVDGTPEGSICLAPAIDNNRVLIKVWDSARKEYLFGSSTYNAERSIRK